MKYPMNTRTENTLCNSPAASMNFSLKVGNSTDGHGLHTSKYSLVPSLSSSSSSSSAAAAAAAAFFEVHD